MVLGAPLGTQEFVDDHGMKRMAEEKRFLDALPLLPDLQCAWLLLYFCAVPRANYLLRCVPPWAIYQFAVEHDEAMWATMLVLLGVATSAVSDYSRHVSHLPCRLGGLGLRSAVRAAPAAYWSAWADALPILHARFPLVVEEYAVQLDVAEHVRACFAAVRMAREVLQQSGFSTPTFREVLAGARPPPPPGDGADPGEWRHGWQFHASDALERRFRADLLPQIDLASRSLLRSQSGPRASAALMAIPYDAATRVAADRFRVVLCRRLRHPIMLATQVCEGCGLPLDRFGDHYAACMRTGRVQARARPAERVWNVFFGRLGRRHISRNSCGRQPCPASPRTCGGLTCWRRASHVSMADHYSVM